jgi:hypothetical protein
MQPHRHCLPYKDMPHNSCRAPFPGSLRKQHPDRRLENVAAINRHVDQILSILRREIISSLVIGVREQVEENSEGKPEK